MASVFGSLRLTGQVSNDKAREIVAAVQALRDAGVEVKGDVDVRFDPEPAPVVAPPAVAEVVAVSVGVDEPETRPRVKRTRENPLS